MKTNEQRIEELLRDFFSQENKDVLGIHNQFWDELHADFGKIIESFKEFVIRRCEILGETIPFNFMDVLPTIIDEIEAVKIDLVKRHCAFLKKVAQEEKGTIQ